MPPPLILILGLKPLKAWILEETDYIWRTAIIHNKSFLAFAIVALPFDLFMQYTCIPSSWQDIAHARNTPLKQTYSSWLCVTWRSLLLPTQAFTLEQRLPCFLPVRMREITAYMTVSEELLWKWGKITWFVSCWRQSITNTVCMLCYCVSIFNLGHI